MNKEDKSKKEIANLDRRTMVKNGADPEIAEEIEIARKAGIDMRRYYRTGMQNYMFILYTNK